MTHNEPRQQAGQIRDQIVGLLNQHEANGTDMSVIGYSLLMAMVDVVTSTAKTYEDRIDMAKQTSDIFMEEVGHIARKKLQ